MLTSKLNDYIRGWIIGDFEPCIFRTKDFEVGVLTHKKGEIKPPHIHKLSTEYNVLLKGKVIIQGKELNTGDVFVLKKGEVADPNFLEDCTFLCVKVPSIPDDKYDVWKPISKYIKEIMLYVYLLFLY